MGIIKTIGQFFKVAMFFLSLWKEKDKEKAAQKAAIGKKVLNAFQQTDKDKRASRLNTVIGDINRMRK